MNSNQKITDYIANASEEQIIILEELRKLIHESADNVSEEIKWGFPVFNSNRKDFCYLRFSTNHVTLGFYNPDKIITHTNLLEGDGTVMKHIKIKSVDTINETIIKEWLHQITH